MEYLPKMVDIDSGVEVFPNQGFILSGVIWRGYIVVVEILEILYSSINLSFVFRRNLISQGR